jgi:hypothetical protein
MKKVILLLVVLFTVSLTSCRSGWSCKKRYVNNKSYDVKKHHVIKEFDKYIVNKYKVEKTNVKTKS